MWPCGADRRVLHCLSGEVAAVMARPSDQALPPSAPEPASGFGPSGNDPSRGEYPCRRSSYEGAGGWKDGRFGQAYDLVWAALKDRGEERLHKHPLLAEIEALDQEQPE